MLFDAGAPRTPAERVGRRTVRQSTHTVVAVELALLFAGGLFFLTHARVRMGGQRRRDFTVRP